jgi:hypothetical protein
LTEPARSVSTRAIGGVGNDTWRYCVERANLTMWMGMRPLTWLTNTFPRSEKPHLHDVAPLGRPHHTLTKRLGLGVASGLWQTTTSVQTRNARKAPKLTVRNVVRAIAVITLGTPITISSIANTREPQLALLVKLTQHPSTQGRTLADAGFLGVRQNCEPRVGRRYNGLKLVVHQTIVTI